MKIGEEIIIKEDFEINGFLSDNSIIVKKGDKGFVNSNGMITYTTGNARGKMQKLKDVEVKGFDYLNIAKILVDRLEVYLPLDEFIEDYDLELKEFIDVIETALFDIL